AEGRVTGVGGVGRNLTAFTAVEEGLRQTKNLDSLGRVVSRIALECRDLLTVINGYCTLLRSKEDAETHAAALTEIEKASRRGTVLTQQLLALNQERARHPKLLNPKTVIEDVAQAVRPVLPGKVQLTLEMEPEPGRVRADADQLHHALLHLAM